ncbi:MAG: MotA/TolQ/ExbB proton channel family protein, partial [Planctomycetota bacterium]|nr:MotA/TolQ/ExbB proton channel family protein [Planctomycetota bacterium]
APLRGFLGTVIGIIQSFKLLGEQSTLTDPRDVSAGIAAALLTTALGLIVALMTLFPYMVFRSHVDRALGRMESVIAAAQQGEQLRRKKYAAVTKMDQVAQDHGSTSAPSESSTASAPSG